MTENFKKVGNILHAPIAAPLQTASNIKERKQILTKFYPLDRDEWLRACHELTPSEKDVLYFIRTSDPYSNGIRVNSAAIARQLSNERHKVHRQTVSRALKSLVEKGFIQVEILEPRLKVLGGGKHSDMSQPTTPDAKTCGKEVPHHTTETFNAPQAPQKPVENECVTTPEVCHHTTINCDTPTEIGIHHPLLKPQMVQAFQDSKISNTNKENLSERGEKFFEVEPEKNLVPVDQIGNQSIKDRFVDQGFINQGADRQISQQGNISSEDSKSPEPPQAAQNSLEIAKTNKDFMDWAVRRSVRLNARNAQIHATTCLKRDEALLLWQEYQRSQIRPQPLYLEFESMADYYRYLEKRREELLYGTAS